MMAFNILNDGFYLSKKASTLPEKFFFDAHFNLGRSNILFFKDLYLHTFPCAIFAEHL